MRAVLVLALAAAGCIKSATFQCATENQCVRDGVQGRCEAIGFCSFPDSSCTTGERFGDYAGSLSNQCVGGSDPDGGMIDAPRDGAIGDGMNPDASACPAGYAPLAGVATHQYKKLSGNASWATQRDACAADGTNTYLAIPADMTELSALATLTGTDMWIGIDDITNEGSFQTVNNQAATFLPWSPGEPDNGGNQDCVEILHANSRFATLNCNNSRSAVCECSE